MTRQNLFSDALDDYKEEDGTRHRVFWRPDDAAMGTLYELAPDAPEARMHMHFGAEEMFFVLAAVPSSGTNTARGAGSGRLRLLPPGTCRTTRSATPRKNRLDPRDQRQGASRTSSPTPNTDMHGWRLAIPIPSNSRRAATTSSLASRSRSVIVRPFVGVARHDKEAREASSVWRTIPRASVG